MELTPAVRAYVEELVEQQIVERLSNGRLQDLITDQLSSKTFRKRLRTEIERSRRADRLVVGPEDRVKIHPEAAVKSVMLNTSSGSITVEKDALVAHFVCLLTGTHEVDKIGVERRQGIPRTGRDIEIRAGAWVATGAMVIGPCVVGEHSVVAAGAVVTQDVAPGTIVAGNPARVLGTVGPDGDRPTRSGGRCRSVGGRPDEPV